MTTVAFMSDASISRYPGDAEYIKDLNLALANAPDKRIDAFVMPGDNDRVAKSIELYNKSNVKTVPAFYIMGNHDLADGDYGILKSMTKPLPVNPGPAGSEKTTYSFDIGRIHVVCVDIYWNGVDKDYFKYGGSDGGWIHPKLMAWIETDLKATRQPFKIISFHEPMYPDDRHMGNSLDKDKANRDQLQALLEKYKVAAVVCGHTHYGDMTLHGSVWSINDGTFGMHTHKYEKVATVIYAHESGGDLSLIWKQDSGRTVKTVTVPASSQPPLMNLTLEQLKAYNGKNGAKAYVAVSGLIYDMSAKWPNGEHNGHLAGQDLTEALKGKHGLDKIKSLPVVGNLIVPAEMWGWKESGQGGVAGECVINPNGTWTSKAACEAAHPPRVKWNGTACVPVGHLHEPDMFDTMEACLAAHPPTERTYEVLSMVGVKVSMKDIITGEVKNFEIIGMVGGTIRLKEVA